MKRIISAFREKWPFYSIELIVITFGILLAFGLNATYQNWNEGRKRKMLELEHLRDIKQSLVSLQTRFRIDTATSIPELLDANEIILRYIDEDLPYSDSLDKHFESMYNCVALVPDYSAYESLKAQGFELISNTSLRRLIQEIFGWWLPIQSDNQFLHCRVIENVIFQHSSNWQININSPPRNFEILKTDNHFTWFLNSNILFLNWQINWEVETLSLLERYVAQFDEEIARLEGQ